MYFSVSDPAVSAHENPYLVAKAAPPSSLPPQGTKPHCAFSSGFVTSEGDVQIPCPVFCFKSEIKQPASKIPPGLLSCLEYPESLLLPSRFDAGPLS